MTTNTSTRPTGILRRMDRTRKIALAAGVLYLVTFVASIPQLKLFKDVIDNRDYISTAHNNTPLLWGSIFEIITALAGIGTAVALYPVTKRVSQSAAIGFITSRVVEGTMIVVGVMSLLTVVTLQHDYAGATGAQQGSLEVTGHALVEARQWTFLLGPGIMPAVNALFLGYVLYRSRLVPRILPTVGLIGAPLLLVSAAGTILGGWDQVSKTAALLALPIAAWEFSLGVWMTVKGFRSTPLTAAAVPAATKEPQPVG